MASSEIEQQGEQHEDRRAAHREERQQGDHGRARQVADDHHRAPGEPVRERPEGRGGDGGHEAHRERRGGLQQAVVALVDEQGERDPGDLVTQVGADLGQQQAANLAIAPDLPQ